LEQSGRTPLQPLDHGLRGGRLTKQCNSNSFPDKIFEMVNQEMMKCDGRISELVKVGIGIAIGIETTTVKMNPIIV
jgi:hypothetical protein